MTCRLNFFLASGVIFRISLTTSSPKISCSSGSVARTSLFWVWFRLGFIWFVGGGVGTHVIVVWSKFPLTLVMMGSGIWRTLVMTIRSSLALALVMVGKGIWWALDIALAGSENLMSVVFASLQSSSATSTYSDSVSSIWMESPDSHFIICSKLKMEKIEYSFLWRSEERNWAKKTAIPEPRTRHRSVDRLS